MQPWFFLLFGAFDIWAIQVPLPVLVLVTAALGCLVSRLKRKEAENTLAKSRQDVQRARMVARELEKIGRVVRRNLARHHVSLTRFKRRIVEMDADHQKIAWDEFCREWEDLLLEPTVRLATQLGQGYEEIRQQISRLTMLSEARTDPLTGVNNRRSLSEALSAQFAMLKRYEVPFCVALFDIDHFKQVNDEHGHVEGDRVLQCLAQLIDQQARETDIVGRYGGEEFVVILPQTGLEGASVFSERLRVRVAEELPITVSGGVAMAIGGDDSDILMARADSALYAAKSAGRDKVFCHDGKQVERVVDAAAASVENRQAPVGQG